MYVVYHKDKGFIVNMGNGYTYGPEEFAQKFFGPSLTEMVNALQDHPDFDELRWKKV